MRNSINYFSFFLCRHYKLFSTVLFPETRIVKIDNSWHVATEIYHFRPVPYWGNIIKSFAFHVWVFLAEDKSLHHIKCTLSGLCLDSIIHVTFLVWETHYHYITVCLSRNLQRIKFLGFEEDIFRVVWTEKSCCLCDNKTFVVCIYDRLLSNLSHCA